MLSRKGELYLERMLGRLYSLWSELTVILNPLMVTGNVAEKIRIWRDK